MRVRKEEWDELVSLVDRGMEKTKLGTFDFSNHHLPSDNLHGSPTGQGNTKRPALADLEYISTTRIGPAYKIAIETPKHAFNPWFDFRDRETDDIVRKKAMHKWMLNTDFKNQFVNACIYDDTFGIGTIIKRYSESFKDENWSEPAPENKTPVAFTAINPRIFMPINVTAGESLDYDEESWKFIGGRFKSQTVHESRVEVIRTRPYINDWRGLSALEPVWLSLLCYMNNLIFLTRGIAKWGNMVVAITGGSARPNKKQRATYLKILEEFEKNGGLFLGKDDRIQFAQTKLGSGIMEVQEILSRDISSGSGLPMNYLFGLSDSGGIGSGGALTAERSLLNKYAIKQDAVEDDLWNILSNCGWDVEELYPSWNVSIQQTREQEIQTELMETQLKMQKIQLRMMEKQAQWVEDNMDEMSIDQTGDELEQASDFISKKEQFKTSLDFFRQQRLQDLGGKV